MSDAKHRHLQDLAAVSGLMAGITHDMNNPLAGILGYCHILVREKDPQRIQRFAEKIQDQAQVLRHLLDDLQQCMLLPEPRPVSTTWADIVSAAMVFHGERLRSAGIDVTVDVPADLPPLQADLDQMRRALARLLDNAVDALESVSEGRRRLSIRARVSGDQSVLELRDNGPGVAPANRERIFDPTFTTRRSGRGVGLGLPGALAILVAHGGDLRLGSSGGSGGSFELVMPTSSTAEIDSAPSDSVLSPSPPAASGDAVRVLCVDDEDFILDIYRDVFEDLAQDVDVDTCATLADALAHIASHEYDLVISDFRQDGGTADDLYRQATESLGFSGRFVICTGDPHHPEVEESMARYPEVGLIGKPFTVIELQALLGELR